VTPYLPLNLDPEDERQVERVLILADKAGCCTPMQSALNRCSALGSRDERIVIAEVEFGESQGEGA
jgi:hypothetical protein